GSFRPEDRILDELARRYGVTVLAQPNAGIGTARNFGVLQARGQYICVLDADNALLPEFVERCVEVLERRPEVAYVTCWLQFVDASGAPLEDGYQPVSSECTLLPEINIAGDATAVLRRSVFERG